MYMKIRNTDAFELNGLALVQNTNYLLLHSYLKAEQFSYEEGINEYIEDEALNKIAERLLHKYRITPKETPESYSAALEMLRAILLESEAINEQYKLDYFPELIDVSEFALGRMLRKINNPFERTRALLAIKELMPDLEDKIDFAIASPEEVIFETEEALAYISEVLEIEKAKLLIDETMLLTIENRIEELIADNKIHVKRSELKSLIESIYNFQNMASQLTGEEVIVTTEEIIEFFGDSK
jgi:hypothetical protein